MTTVYRQTETGADLEHNFRSGGGGRSSSITLRLNTLADIWCDKVTKDYHVFIFSVKEETRLLESHFLVEKVSSRR